MQKYQNNIQDQFGNAVTGATVEVRNVVGGGLSTIFSDDGGTGLGNPFTAQSGSEFFFYAANQRFNIIISGPVADTIDDIVLFDSADISSLFFAEQNAANASVAGKGQLWVRDDVPNVLVFTDDSDVDVVLGGGGGATQLSDLTDVTSAAVTNLFALMADGAAYVGRRIGEADIQQLPANNGIFLSLGLNNTITGGITVDNTFVNWIFGNSTNVTWRSAGDSENMVTSMTGTRFTFQGSGFAPPDLEVFWNNFTQFRLGVRLDTHASLATGGSSNPGSGAPLRIPHGVTPTTPVNGDFWTTTAGLFVQINGGTVGPLVGGGIANPMTTDLDGDGFNLNDMGVLFMREQATADADITAQGQWWVQSQGPNVPFFTDDTGIDQLLDPSFSPIISIVANYTFDINDKGKTAGFTGSTAAQTVTIPASGSAAYKIGTFLRIDNDGSVSISIAITTDTLIFADDATTGTRTLAAGGSAVAQKIGATRWKIAGAGLT